MSPTVSVVLPVYNGRALLEVNLPILLRATRGRNGLEVIIVDDGSVDGTAEFLKARFPEIVLVALSSNQGVIRARNAGVAAATGEILYFLDSDVQVREGFLDPVREAFSDPSMFAVGSREVSSQTGGKIIVATPFFRFGLFGHRYVVREIPRHSFLAPFVPTSHAAYSRHKLLSLGGFDDLYRPIYWEDVDLCYRAWQHGWRVIIEPASVADHALQGTTRRLYSPVTIQSIYWKNRFLFIWKNLRDRALLAEHLVWLPLLLLGLPVVRGRAVLRGFAGALGQLSEALGKRRRDAGKPAVSDREILNMFTRRA
ncbi:MAG: glycosyltransferase [Candidatus Rokubacteria bacterium]|nr:glycosyltransferase [Candidatus Rokubacteria bacterium]